MRRALVIICCLAGTVPGAAQIPETREEKLRQEREAKAAAVRPNEPDPLQRGLAFVEERGLFMTARDGWHPTFGGLATGSGFALGVGYRTRSLFARHGTLDVFAAVSRKTYWGTEVRATFPALAGGRLFAEGVASLRENTEERFFGLGPGSQRADETSYLLRTARLGGRAAVRVAPLTSAGASLDYLSPRVGRGRNDEFPSTGDRYQPEELPGLGVPANFVRSAIFAEIDYREPKNPRRGGLYRVERAHYADRTGTQLAFNRTDVDLRQYLGFLAGRRVIALRGVVSTSDLPADSIGVPFYLTPFLGGKDTLRGFRNHRYRGPHALLLQAEYRWEIWSALEAALFYDAGKVALDRRDVNLRGLQHGYGFGFRFNTDTGVVLRFDAAFGSGDGKRLHMNMGGVF